MFWRVFVCLMRCWSCCGRRPFWQEEVARFSRSSTCWSGGNRTYICHAQLPAPLWGIRGRSCGLCSCLLFWSWTPFPIMLCILSYCHLVPGDDVLLRDCFWSGLDLNISLNLPDEDPGWTLVQYIDFVLLFRGSELTVVEVEEEVSPKKKNLGGGGVAVGRGLQWPWSPAGQDCHHATHWRLQVQCLSPLPCHTRANSQDGCHAPVRISNQDGRNVTARVNIQNGCHIKVRSKDGRHVTARVSTQDSCHAIARANSKMAAMLQSESALKMAAMSQPESTCKMATISRSAPKMATMSQPESAPKIAARPQPEPPPARAASSPATSSVRVATSPVWFATPEPPAIMKATKKSSATMNDTPEFPVVMDVKPEFPVVSSVVFGDNKAFSGRVVFGYNKAFYGRLRLASSLADPPLRSVRAAGIPRPSAVEIIEVVPLSAVLPVMAVALLCVWAVHCTLTSEPSPVQVSGSKSSPVRESVPKPSSVQVSDPEPSPVRESIPEPSPVQVSGPKSSRVQESILELSPVQISGPEPSSVKDSVSEPSPVTEHNLDPVSLWPPSQPDPLKPPCAPPRPPSVSSAPPSGQATPSALPLASIWSLPSASLTPPWPPPSVQSAPPLASLWSLPSASLTPPWPLLSVQSAPALASLWSLPSDPLIPPWPLPLILSASSLALVWSQPSAQQTHPWPSLFHLWLLCLSPCVRLCTTALLDFDSVGCLESAFGGGLCHAQLPAPLWGIRGCSIGLCFCLLFWSWTPFTIMLCFH